jgi:RNA polymerase sigma factor (sigma-70 family)
MNKRMDESVGTLVYAVLRGDQGSWDRLVTQFENLVWSVVRSFQLSDADSLDAAQMTWLRLVEKLDGVTDPDRIGSWLITTARRECLEILNRQSRTTPVDPIEAFRHLVDPVDSLHGVHARDDLERIFAAFKALPEKCRSLLRVALADPPPSYQEISDALGVPVGTIGPRRQRCLAQLRAAAGTVSYS